MAPPKDATKTPLRAIATDSSKMKQAASSTLEDALAIFELLSNLTKDVPYLNIIMGCIQRLVDIQKTMKANKERAHDLLNKVGEVSRVVAQGLYDLDEDTRNVAMNRLSGDLQRYETVLNETRQILEHWMAKGFIKRVVAHGDFAGIADGIERRMNTFHDAFEVSRLIALSKGQDTLDAKIQTLNDRELRKKLDDWLRPANVAVSQRDAANKRHSDTGKWLLERSEFQDWIYSQKSLLWLQGISGSGKTVLSSTIIETLRVRAESLAFFYFDTNNLEQVTVTQLLCSLVTQLSVQAPAPDRTLNALWSSYANGQHLPPDSVLIEQALLPILREFTDPVYIVLDALDECSEREKLLQSLTKILDAGLPNVHLLLTSRPEVVLHSSNELFQRAVHVSLEGCVDQDIKAYITEILSKLDIEWPEERRAQIKKGLLERGGGMFRLVALQLDELRTCDGRESQVTKVLSELPTSLDASYDRILENIKDEDMLSNVYRMMNWMLFSKRPLKLKQIIDSLAFDFGKQPLRFSSAERMRPHALLDACAGLVATSKSEWGGISIKVAHASVKEYFLSSKRLRGLHSDCQVSEQTAHYWIARTCIGYLCSFECVIDNNTDLEQYPLAQYAARYWASHLTDWDEIGLDRCKSADKPSMLYNFDVFLLLHSLLSALIHVLSLFVEGMMILPRTKTTTVPKVQGTSSSRLVDTVLELVQSDSAPYMTLSRLWDNENHPSFFGHRKSAPIVPPLCLLAQLGIGQVVWELLKQGADANTEGGRDGNALQAAAKRGHTNIVHLLLEHGADVHAQGGEQGNALSAASYGGHTDIAHLLLEQGADVNTQGGCFGNALSAASQGGHNETVNLLLKQGADVNAQGGEYGNALQAAALGGSKEIVQLLLEQGVNTNVQGGFYGNALQAAARGGSTEIMQLLLEQGANVNVQCGFYGNALKAAAQSGSKEKVQLLLEQGADVNAQGGKYGNALRAARTAEVEALLLAHGAVPNEEDGESLSSASSSSHDYVS
ncbi:hypothetical protein B0H17DRAFT_640612 [Mycena rosella]|uniref:NACHT domain-containing protein n=1 Tax=Mycena rosella TaxID=1033263 RepID=A0AAD7DGX3_MYCRO|nr:hypothetical protein B0H17DRAFT_640612 [Mycena rosella]